MAMWAYQTAYFVVLALATGTFPVTAVSLGVQPQPKPLPAVLSPVLNGIDISGNRSGENGLPFGLLDVTKAPFFADNTGKTDATQAIQAAVKASRISYVTTYLPPG